MITSTANPQVKNLQQLMKKSSVRSAQDVFLVEGMKMFLEAPRERIQKIYVSKSLYEEKGQAFFDGVSMEILDDRVYAAVSDTKTPQGILSRPSGTYPSGHANPYSAAFFPAALNPEIMIFRGFKF